MSPLEPRRITAAQIIKAVADQYGIRVAEIMGESRVAYVAFARQVAMYLSRVDCLMSYTQIGAVFNRDHTTAIAAYRRVGEAKIEHVLGEIRQRIAGTPVPSRPAECQNCQTLRMQLADAYRLIDGGGE